MKPDIDDPLRFDKMRITAKCDTPDGGKAYVLEVETRYGDWCLPFLVVSNSHGGITTIDLTETKARG